MSIILTMMVKRPPSLKVSQPLYLLQQMDLLQVSTPTAVQQASASLMVLRSLSLPDCMRFKASLLILQVPAMLLDGRVMEAP
ncbi:MAG: hypothetical protein IJ249_07740 [Paludibacteraceae bacterium]|nr:hypothetical protein [Paludibacteraceae bacterium]